MLCMRGCRSNDELIAALQQPAAGSAPLNAAKRFPRSPLEQFRLILGKNLTLYWRTTQYNAVCAAVSGCCARLRLHARAELLRHWHDSGQAVCMCLQSSSAGPVHASARVP
jgi:hypothetical protein